MEAALWVALGVVLAVAEMFTLSFVLVMFAAGAFAAALAAALGANLVVQVAVFAVVSALALGAVRPVIQRHRRAGEAEGGTRMGVDAIEGSTGLVLEQVDADNGVVKIEGEIWRARAFDGTQVIEPGERVRVIEIKGATAMVWRDM